MLGVHMWTGGGAGVGRATYGRVGAISGHRLAEGGRTQSGVERLHWRVGAVLSELSAQLSLPRGDGGKKGEGQKLLTTTPLLLPMSTLGRVWGEI